MNIINETGLYSLILKSKLQTDKKFKRWIPIEVLPSIRKLEANKLLMNLTQAYVKLEVGEEDIDDEIIPGE